MGEFKFLNVQKSGWGERRMGDKVSEGEKEKTRERIKAHLDVLRLAILPRINHQLFPTAYSELCQDRLRRRRR